MFEISLDIFYQCGIGKIVSSGRRATPIITKMQTAQNGHPNATAGVLYHPPSPEPAETGFFPMAGYVEGARCDE